MKDKETNRAYTIPKDHHSLKHIDYGYASIVHSAQGKTSDNVIAVIESYRKNLTSQKTFYVEVSRAKNDISLIVDNKEKVINQLDIMTGEKSSGLEVKEDCKQVNYNKMNDTLKSIASSSYKENKQQSIEMIK
jgi:ATP-dependent exoDNAse (exonuclease V) alpha subunit